MNKTTILAISAVFVASILAITAFEAEAEPPSRVICPAENVQHWMNFKAVTNNDLIHSSEPTISTTIIFLPVPFSGGEVFINDNKFVIISDRLNDLGYTQADGDPVDIFDISSVDTFPPDVGYSTICAE